MISMYVRLSAFLLVACNLVVASIGLHAAGSAKLSHQQVLGAHADIHKHKHNVKRKWRSDAQNVAAALTKLVEEGHNETHVVEREEKLKKFLAQAKEKFEDFDSLFGEEGSALHTLRLCLFRKAHSIVQSLNNRTGTKAKFDLFLDHAFIAPEEFQERRGGLIVPDNSSLTPENSETELLEVDYSSQYPSSVDYVGNAVLSEPMNQGSCGGCWAFAASEAMYAMNYLNAMKNGEATPPAVNLSPQELISCDTGVNKGCNGGNYAFVWGTESSPGWTATHQLVTYSQYPYVAETGSCNFSNLNNTGVTSLGTSYAARSSWGAVQQLQSNPLAISIYAAAPCFQYYKGGILTPEDCSDTISTCPTVDHAVLLVGYSNYGSSDFAFKVKNSWGTSWGDNGFVYLDGNSGGACNGMLDMFSSMAYPTTTNLKQVNGQDNLDPNPYSANSKLTAYLSLLFAAFYFCIEI